MTESTAKPKAKRASRASGARKPAAKATKTANAGKAKGPAKPGAKAKVRKGEMVKPASRLIDQRIRDLGDWREETLARMRALILEADPEMIEERKWRKPSNAMAGVPVWSHHGIVCTGASPSAFATRGLLPERTMATFSPFRTLIGLASLAPGLAFAPAFGGDLAFVPAFAVFLALAAGLRAPLARDARLAFGFALLSVIIRVFC